MDDPTTLLLTALTFFAGGFILACIALGYVVAELRSRSKPFSIENRGGVEERPAKDYDLLP
jgi:hypothetical protein